MIYVVRYANLMKNQITSDIIAYLHLTAKYFI